MKTCIMGSEVFSGGNYRGTEMHTFWWTLTALGLGKRRLTHQFVMSRKHLMSPLSRNMALLWHGMWNFLFCCRVLGWRMKMSNLINWQSHFEPMNMQRLRVTVSWHISPFLFPLFSPAHRAWRPSTSTTTRWATRASTSWRMGWSATALCCVCAWFPPSSPARVSSPSPAPASGLGGSHVWCDTASLCNVLLLWLYGHFVPPPPRCCGPGRVHRWEPPAPATGSAPEWDQDRGPDGPVPGTKGQHLTTASRPGQRAQEGNCEDAD